jgi:hypothetical protein
MTARVNAVIRGKGAAAMAIDKQEFWLEKCGVMCGFCADTAAAAQAAASVSTERYCCASRPLHGLQRGPTSTLPVRVVDFFFFSQF